MDEILQRLLCDEVITFESVKALNGFHDYLIEQGIDPDEFRRHRLDVWKA